jgi:4-alpha-glucanotransferase
METKNEPRKIVSAKPRTLPRPVQGDEMGTMPHEALAMLPPFVPGFRTAGVLLHVTSLPSPYGIGDLGPAASSWVDRLHDAGQGWWQSLPLGPTGYGNSPYQCLSSFAGNCLLISPELLIGEGLLRAGDCEETQPISENAVDFKAAIAFKHRLLEKAWSNFGILNDSSMRIDFERFCFEQAHWLDDYALFRSLKAQYRGAAYLEWPVELVLRKPQALAAARHELVNRIDENRFAQFLLFRQGEQLKEYSHKRGIQLIGDLPFFVSPDSSDVWTHPEWFLLDDQRRPRFVAGVPPDYFSSHGQLWGNPMYDWEALRQTGYHWCIKRMRALLAHVDLVRLDHFRGFSAAWHVSPSAATAESGHWAPGPGADFFKAVQRELGNLPFIAEDLGTMTAEVGALRNAFGLPGTRVLQFAFDGHSDNPHLPDNFTSNTVVYTGTHDNTTTRAWFETLPENIRRIVRCHLGRPNITTSEVAGELIRLAWSSKAGLAMVPLQDLLNIGAEGRMNLPGTAEGNWRWRCSKKMLTASVFDSLNELTSVSGRFIAPRETLQTQTAKASA